MNNLPPGVTQESLDAPLGEEIYNPMKDEIKLKVEVLKENVMFLNTHLGNGSLGKTEFDASLRLPDHSIVVTVGKNRYMVTSQSIISAVVDNHIEHHAK